jgi:hypothetical protein
MSDLSQDMVCTDGTFTTLPFQALEWRREEEGGVGGAGKMERERGECDTGADGASVMTPVIVGAVKLGQIAVPKGALCNIMVRVRCKSQLGWGLWSPASDAASTVDMRCLRPPEVTASPTAHTVSLRWGPARGGERDFASHSSGGSDHHSQLLDTLHQPGVAAGIPPALAKPADIAGFRVDKVTMYTLLVFDPHDTNCTGTFLPSFLSFPFLPPLPSFFPGCPSFRSSCPSVPFLPFLTFLPFVPSLLPSSLSSFPPSFLHSILSSILHFFIFFLPLFSILPCVAFLFFRSLLSFLL